MCQTRKSISQACGYSSRRRIPCGRAKLRAANFLCLGYLIKKYKSEKLRKIRFGLCSRCEAHFRPFRINDPRYVEKYIAYKQAHGLGKVDASVTPVDTIFTRFDMRRLHGQNPVRATAPVDSRQPSPQNLEQATHDSLSRDDENAASNRSWSPALAGSCVGEICPADGDIYFSDFSETGSPGKGRAPSGAKMPGLYRGSDIKETTLYVPRDGVLDFGHPAPLLGACPQTAWWRCGGRRAWSKYAKAEWTPARWPVVRPRLHVHRAGHLLLRRARRRKLLALFRSD